MAKIMEARSVTFSGENFKGAAEGRKIIGKSSTCIGRARTAIQYERGGGIHG